MVVGPSPPSRAAEWGAALQTTAGHEDQQVLEPGPDPVTLPGGVFADLLLDLDGRWSLDESTDLWVGSRTWLERFEGSDRRLLLSQWIGADLRRRWGEQGRLRISANGSGFDDSGLDTRRRFIGGLEAGLAWERPSSSVELVAAGGLRAQPDLTVSDAEGRPVDYRERRGEVGLVAAVRPGPGLILTAEGRRQLLDANDPLWDGASWILAGSARWRLLRRLHLQIRALGQWRRFDGRAPVEKDRYLQWGIGGAWSLGPGLEAQVRFVESRYRWPAGEEDLSHRVEVGLRWLFSGGASPLPPPPPVPPPPEAGPVRLRLRAPAADAVSVVGDFNAWRVGADPLRPVGEGWWEVDLDLVPGRYQYAYVVDGEVVSPPDAQILVDDGFGGRNGLLEVGP
jgi:hypothetical protein